jgi:hypothetical protein
MRSAAVMLGLSSSFEAAAHGVRPPIAKPLIARRTVARVRAHASRPRGEARVPPPDYGQTSGVARTSRPVPHGIGSERRRCGPRNRPRPDRMHELAAYDDLHSPRTDTRQHLWRCSRGGDEAACGAAGCGCLSGRLEAGPREGFGNGPGQPGLFVCATNRRRGCSRPQGEF